MDGATLQGKIYGGYAKAALRIGLSTDHYRPTSAINPTATGNKLHTFQASFNAEDMTYGKPNKYGHPIWWGLFDGSLTQPGDYLINSKGEDYFIAGQQPNLPIMCISCNAVVTVLRPQQQSGVGALGYGGDISSNETALMTGWPCSILQGGKGEKLDAVLPGDTKSPQWSVLLPKYGSVMLRTGDIITDDRSGRFVVASAELTDLGWRMTAAQDIT